MLLKNRIFWGEREVCPDASKEGIIEKCKASPYAIA
jgi:hypothetical protein